MSVVLLNDAMVHYEVLGRGRPVIFLHGWVGSWRYWISSMQVTSTSYRAYALDLWGFGGTAHKKDRYNIKGQSQLVRSFLTAMGIGKIALVGHGYGAIVALDFTSTYPSIVDRVMLTNCSLDEKATNKKLFSDTPEALANWLTADLPNAQAALSEAKKTDADVFQLNRKETSSYELFNAVNRQHTPCLLVSSAQDKLVAPPNMTHIDSLSDFGHHILLNESGHFPMLDSTAIFNRLLTDFLALDSGLSIKELGLKEEWKRRVR